jgi:hypothetical protein
MVYTISIHYGYMLYVKIFYHFGSYVFPKTFSTQSYVFDLQNACVVKIYKATNSLNHF